MYIHIHFLTGEIGPPTQTRAPDNQFKKDARLTQLCVETPVYSISWVGVSGVPTPVATPVPRTRCATGATRAARRPSCA